MLWKGDKKGITIFAVCVFFFALAGVFQAIDYSMPEFYHALFSLSAHVILITLVIVWGVSLKHRMVRRDLLIFLLTIASLMLFFLVARMIKYGLCRETDTLGRYMWYSYYIAQCFIPPTLLLIALSLENKNGKPLEKYVYAAAYLPALILVALIYSNDLHEWAFKLNFSADSFSYSHRPVFYAAIIWEFGVTAVSIGVLMLKCSVSACRKKIWLPVCAFLLCAAFTAVCFVFDSSAFKQPELLCFTCVTVIESCIFIGLIPSNKNYERYFDLSEYAAIITDENFRIEHKSLKAPILDESLLRKACLSPVMLDENTRFCSEKIHGGYAYRTEDISKINEINAEIKEANERIEEENYIIVAENELKEQKARVTEQNRLYTKTAESVNDELLRLKKIVSEAKAAIDDEKAFGAAMRSACVSAAYIKRKSNLVMLGEKSPYTDFEEVALAVKESLDYLSTSKVDCLLKKSGDGKIKTEYALIVYDFFEFCLNASKIGLSAFMVNLSLEKSGISVRIESDGKIAEKENLTNDIGKAFPTGKTKFEDEDGVSYFSLFLSIGGDV